MVLFRFDLASLSSVKIIPGGIGIGHNVKVFAVDWSIGVVVPESGFRSRVVVVAMIDDDEVSLLDQHTRTPSSSSSY